MKYPMADTVVFYKQKDETLEAFYIRVFNSLIINNQLVEAVRINLDPTWVKPNSNWIAVDYTNLSTEDEKIKDILKGKI